ncbi:MAG: hypothetical protein GY750_14535 [Lentisphaerae bacterium]|nr:hypothetical protein [Lentisphaerota bacterium]MCP4102619.1 hypothetical protein [Lentisphaerota bacterium]
MQKLFNQFAFVLLLMWLCFTTYIIFYATAKETCIFGIPVVLGDFALTGLIESNIFIVIGLSALIVQYFHRKKELKKHKTRCIL